jgi:uncharacterized protein (TIGR02231 family)
MRVLTALLFVAVFSSSVVADEIAATSRINSVTVFSRGAEVSRVSRVSINKGEHVIVFEDLPARALRKSIRVEGSASGKLEIGSVDTRRLSVPRADAETAASERRRIEDEIERLKDQKLSLAGEVQAAETQKALIANLAELPNRPAPPANAGARGEDWPEVLALIRSASADAQQAMLTAKVKLREVDRAIADLKKKLPSLAPTRESRTEVRVSVSTDSLVEADLTLRYQVNQASWLPHYDARLSTGSKTVAPKLNLVRRASVSQRSGESWEDVTVTLSTTRPSGGASAPELFPVTVDFEPERVVRPNAAPAAGGLMSMEEDAVGAAVPAEAEAQKERLARAPMKPKKRMAVVERRAAVAATPFQVLYTVPGKLTVTGHGEPQQVRLFEETFEPQLMVRTVPKERAKAYLYAKLALAKSTPLLPGSVSLFRDGTFVGTGDLPILSPGEDHDLGFGVDDLVRVRHSIVEEKSGETGLISTSRTKSHNYSMTIKNLHERMISVSIFDQIPVSKNEEIKVELVGKSAPTRKDVDEKRGVLAWEMKLEPDQEQVVEFGYRVSWPSAKSVVYGR